MSLFGHHHAAAGASLAGTVGGFAHAVPVPIWVASLGVLAAVATPLVQHVFERSRDRTLAATEERRLSADRVRAQARVRTDLLVRLKAHLAFLDAAAARGSVDVERWSAAFDALAARMRDVEVIDALGPSYRDVADAAHAETLALEAARAATLGAGPRVAGAAGLGDVIASYEPVLGLLAEPALPLPREPALGRGR